MRFTLERIVEPEEEPVTLAEIIEHVREFSSISQAAQDQLTSLIVAGREWVEDYTGRALFDQTWRLTVGSNSRLGNTVSGFPQGNGNYFGDWRWDRLGELQLRKSPVLAITAFQTVAADGTTTDIDAATYAVREASSKWPRLVALDGATWATAFPGEMRIEFRAGFADTTGSPQQTAAEIPERFKQAIKLWVEANYDRDEKMMGLLLETAQTIIRPERADLSLA